MTPHNDLLAGLEDEDKTKVMSVVAKLAGRMASMQSVTQRDIDCEMSHLSNSLRVIALKRYLLWIDSLNVKQ